MSRKCPVTEEAIVNDLVMGSVDKAGIDLLQSSVINARPDPVSTTACSSVADIVSCTNGVGGGALRVMPVSDPAISCQFSNRR